MRRVIANALAIGAVVQMVRGLETACALLALAAFLVAKSKEVAS